MIASILIGVAAITQPHPASSKEIALLRAIADGYESNRTAIAAGSFEFEYSSGKAEDIDEARAGRFRRYYTATGLYAFDKDTARYERIIPVADQAAVTSQSGPNQFTWLGRSFRAVFDGHVTLRHDIYVTPEKDKAPNVSQTLDLTSGPKQFKSGFYFPIGCGRLGFANGDLAAEIRQALGGSQGLVIEGLDTEARSGDRPVAKIEIKMPRGRRTYWVDREIGCIPREISDDVSNVTRKSVTFNDDVRRLGSCWLPFLTTRIYGGSEVTQLRILRADVDHKPDRSTFRLDFPEPVMLIDQVHSTSFPARKRWSIDELPGPQSRGAEKIPIKQQPLPAPPPMPVEREAWPRWIRVAVALCGVAGVVVVLFGWRRAPWLIDRR